MSSRKVRRAHHHLVLLCSPGSFLMKEGSIGIILELEARDRNDQLRFSKRMSMAWRSERSNRALPPSLRLFDSPSLPSLTLPLSTLLSSPQGSPMYKAWRDRKLTLQD